MAGRGSTIVARSPRGGPAGDLYIFVSVKQHPLFVRDEQARRYVPLTPEAVARALAASN